jgi:hypothetical protein
MTRNTRTQGDWGALVLAELDGHESPGTVARLIAEATGKAVTLAEDDVVAALLRLADKLGAPAKVAQQLKDLTAAAAVAKTEQANAVKAKSDAAADIAKARKDHELRLTRELAAHEQALADGRAEVDAMRKEAAKVLAQAKVDADAAAKLKARLERKLSALEAA